MEQKETPLDHLFQEFQSAFNQASPEEKRRAAAQINSWAKQQVDPPADLSPHSSFDLSQSISSHDPILPEMQDLIGNEIHLRQIAENVEQVFWLSDIHSEQLLYISPAFEMVWGRPREDLYADPLILIESVHPEDRVQVMAASSYQDQKPFNQVYRILRPDGALRWIFSRTFSIRDEAGETLCLFCIAQDITDQKQVEMALRKTLDRTREQFNLSRKMSLARNPEAVLKTLMSAHELRGAQRAALLFFDNPKIGPVRGVDVTAAWSSSLTLSPWLSEANLYEEPGLWDLLRPNRTMVISGIQTDLRLTPLLRDLLREGQIQTMVIFPLVASGNWLGCLLVYYQQDHTFDHIELRYLKVLVDQATITLYNLQLLEVEEESRHEAERANEIKTEFLAMISHELRTPLTSIIGFTTTLLAEDVVWEPEEERDFIQTMQQEANRLQELIDHLLDLSRMEAGMLSISLGPNLLHDIMEDALPQFHILTREQTLTIHLPANLPPVYADAKRIAQVLVNLVRNASTYAPKGSEITLTANVRDKFVQVSVIDQGPGIPPSERKRVFEPFRRGIHEENGAGKGAGLGLAICKGLVEAHGGRIWIKKQTTPGTTISFTIPLASSPSFVNTTGKA